ncbi:chlorinating enzyme [Streptacidiphilus sp. PB12-B1b]|uniref:chlorinating enzyme n=1 Tax=Streptacidiphilus sp. PB12-B1b TaxID=2705012 RepID=UPI0015FD7F4C|nr:chlorinating enzyme [Streptacidiphilus sp. PB12-B1b]QMU77043.1 chlorinating enzyme [Streptacidiphilus sp. PB12-B1b]
MDERDFSLSPEELAQFERDGFIGPFDLYDEVEMEKNLGALRPKLLNTKKSVYSDEKTASAISNYDRHLDIDALGEHIARPEIVDRVASILGPDTLCWRSEFLMKYPGDEGTDWHQAEDFSSLTDSKSPQIQWPEGSERRGTVTVWTAFTEASVETGCLQFIPGTHTQMNYDETKGMDYDSDVVNALEKDGTRRGFFGYDYRQLQKDPNWRPDESRAVSQVMRPGQFIIFWSTLMHASHPNTSADKARLGYSVRYLPTAARVYPGLTELKEFGSTISLERYGSVLTSGVDEFRHNRFVDTTVNGYRFPVRATRVSA